MSITTRLYKEQDIPEMLRIWNEIIEAMVRDSIDRARAAGFRILQFNCVVEGNKPARELYKKLGFVQIGTIEGGLQIKDGSFVNTCPYYIDLTK